MLPGKKSVQVFWDKENHFFETFDALSGKYVRSGVYENGKQTNKDPFMRCFPNLIDIGIMGHCVCARHCVVDCYQRAIDRTGRDMSLDEYKSIMDQCERKVFQVALGGAGDPDTHENFEDILRVTRQVGIVPNFTTSGIAMTERKAELCREYCGAVAVSEHEAEYTRRTLDLLIKAGVRTNLHYVLSATSIDAAIERLRTNYYGDLNAVVFLLYKPIGLGKAEKVLKPDDPRLEEFFALVDSGRCTHKIGFDSCTAPAIINHCHKVDLDSIDFCEGGRYSMYIDSDMNAMPCSFGNQDKRWFVSLRDHTIEEAWKSDVFERFRDSLRNSCAGCDKRVACAGGCPICRSIVLCNRDVKDLR